MKKTPAQTGEISIDNFIEIWYHRDARVLPVDGSPLYPKEVTGIWGDWAVTSFALSVFLYVRKKRNDHHAKSQKLFPCYHPITPFSILGVKKSTPERGRPPTVSRQHHDYHITLFNKFQLISYVPPPILGRRVSFLLYRHIS